MAVAGRSYALRPRSRAGFYRPVAGDTTAPTPDIVSFAGSRISRVSGKDASTFTITADEAFVEYKIKIVSDAGDPHTAGVLVEQATVASTTSTGVDVTDDEIVAAEGSVVDGPKLVKVFVKDAAGNWSA